MAKAIVMDASDFVLCDAGDPDSGPRPRHSARLVRHLRGFCLLIKVLTKTPGIEAED